MNDAKKAIPITRPKVTAYISPRGAEAAIDFYKKAFGATETSARITMPDGKIGHAEIRIGDTAIMLAEEAEDYHALSPEKLGGTTVAFVLTVEDCDAVTEAALAAGATLTRPLENQFYGERRSEVRDPFGYRWMISTPIEEISDEEMLRRANELFNAS